MGGDIYVLSPLNPQVLFYFKLQNIISNAILRLDSLLVRDFQQRQGSKELDGFYYHAWDHTITAW